LRSAHSGRISANCLEEICQAFGKKVAAIMKVECSDLGREISEDLCDALETMSHEDNKAPLRFMEKFVALLDFVLEHQLRTGPGVQ